MRLCPPLLLLVAAAFGQTRFEVASIKPSVSPLEFRAKGLTPPRPVIDTGRFQTYGTLGILIRTAFGLEQYQTLSGPDWMNTMWFEITAKMPENATRAQTPAMLAALLGERFGLVVRRETAEKPVYVLVAGKDGPTFKVAPAGDLTSQTPFPNGVPAARTLLYETNAGPDGWQTYSMLKRDSPTMVFEAARITMRQLAAVLTRQVDLPVVDKTGLSDAYEISLPVPHGPNDSLAAGRPGMAGGLPAQAQDPSGVDIFKSVEKLGLHLEKSRASIESLTVEHLEKTPTDN